MSEINFIGKQEIVGHHWRIPYSTLVPNSRRSVGEVQMQGNLIIEGDNLIALKALLPLYAEKVKCIYIDPPYNTGNKEWAYNDAVDSAILRKWRKKEGIDRDDQCRHDKWLCMMYPRLSLLKELLAEDGVIFISIDDNEQHELRLIMNEIFGESNYITTLHTEMSVTQGMKVASAQKGKIVKNAEFVLIYCKDSSSVSDFLPLYEKRGWDDHYSIYYDKKTKGRSTLTNFITEKIKKKELALPKEFRKKDLSELYENNKEIRKFLHSNSSNIYRDGNCDIKLSLSKAQEEALKKKEIVEYSSKNRKYLLYENKNNTIVQLISLETAIGETDDFIPGYGLRKIRGDLWKEFHKDMMNVSKEGGVGFKNGKKPMRLIKDFLKMINDKDALVLDSFAGSGTTAHAVLSLNKEDKGNRKFILIEGEDYAYKTTAERVRNVIKGTYKNGKALGGSFTYANIGKEIDHEKMLRGESMPSWSTLAQHVFWLATGETLEKEPKENKKNFVGRANGVDVYLLYQPSVKFLESKKSYLTSKEVGEIKNRGGGG